jgi:hypothetical protein
MEVDLIPGNKEIGNMESNAYTHNSLRLTPLPLTHVHLSIMQ